MTNTGILSLIIIVVNIIVSWKGLKDPAFYDRYKFEVDKILIYKDYKRLVTSSFLHVSWMHLIFNMFSLYFFSGNLEMYLGEWRYLLIYFASMVGGDLFSLYIHRNHGDYTSAGASGAIFGIMFAAIAVFPGMDIGLFFLPIQLPAWLFGLIYVLASIYGIRSKKDNIGHEAHLGGGIIGMLVAILLVPSSLLENYFAILVILVPSAAFIYMIVKHPNTLLVSNLYYTQHNYNYTVEDRYNARIKTRQEQLDALLDKISRKGINSLTKKERERLEEYSKTTQ